ncbi:MAG: hypothetical protein ACOYMG_27910 [Candidatus Methylumidiphilus sp.]
MSTPKTPPLVDYYAGQWPRYVKMAVGYANEIKAFSVGEQDIIRDEEGGQKAYWGVFPQDSDNHLYAILRKQAENMIGRLVWLATEAFPPKGVKIEIHGKDYTDQFLPEDDSFLSFDPMAVWIALTEKYSGNGGSNIAYGQSAELLVSLFRLKKGMTMETKAGAVILNLDVYLDSFDLRHSKRKTLGYGSRGELCRALVALEAFFSWAEIDLGLNGLQRLTHRFNYSNYSVESRERISVANGLAIVTFHGCFEFRFSAELAEKFAMYVSLHGFDALDMAA